MAKKVYAFFGELSPEEVEARIEEYSSANAGWTVHSMGNDHLARYGFWVLFERDDYDG